MKRFNITSSLLSVAALSMLFASTASAQESVVPVPWENIVSADDTAVFWVLASFAVLMLILIWVVAGVTKGLLSDQALWKDKISSGAKAVAALVGTSLFLNSTSVFADGGESGAVMFEMSDGLFWIMVIVDVFLLFILLGMIYNLSSLIKALRTSAEEEEVEESVAESIWTGSLSGAVALEEEKDILMDHEYDGIMELDNKLPPWWLYMFYFTIVFGVIYIGYYHFSDGPSQLEEYQNEMAMAEEEQEEFLATEANNVDESTVTYLSDAASIESGKKMYNKLMCKTCHGETGGSAPTGVGPNLTDEFWLNGGGIKNVFKTIKYGVPEKGMVAWGPMMTPQQLQELSSYVLSLQGSNPENAKEPQGEKWVAPVEEAAPADTTEQAPASEAETADAAE